MSLSVTSKVESDEILSVVVSPDASFFFRTDVAQMTTITKAIHAIAII